DAVEWFCRHLIPRQQATSLLRDVADLERLINRVRGGNAFPRELVALRRSLEIVPRLRDILQDGGDVLGWLISGIRPCPEVVDIIAGAIADEPASSSADGGVMREGFSPELDELRHANKDAKEYLANLERHEKERTGIRSLKVGYNRVFGYYIEVTRSNLSQVPEDYIRKQTLAEAERFFTPQLKEYESLILTAQERIVELESSLFRQVCRQIAEGAEQVLSTALIVAEMDVFVALAEVAQRYGYVRPQLNDENAIHIVGGRHPVVERNLSAGSFMPNDADISNEDAQVIILTGPNMAGKSTYLRQVALIVLLAQIGSFVPAESVTTGLVDRIFTRIGLQDDLTTGRSTFMVEMIETAGILNNATPRSLIILDEIGRGTSTYDGLSIAQAVVEFIHNQPDLGSKTLFATHYHELVEMASILPRVKNLNVAVTEEGGQVVFLRKIVPGGADRSYGIHVAQLAGLPRAVIHRASEVLADLEGDHQLRIPSSPHKRFGGAPSGQMPLLTYRPGLMEEVIELDIDSMTPIEAINKLYELQEKARDGR
ncbi:MAG: DNA mismatch repair protein MutS, partial [Dehalococcoidia bacterium]|nr:DNA mismatch repair protein MutS [Dehalococcoidia bacterium]